jgi:aryl-alcohol dehydrogenase-like predicted oxidoreductase
MSHADARPSGSYVFAGREVARVGYGAMALERFAENPDAGVALVRRAIELGVDHVDTADFYGDATANGIVGRAVGARDSVVIATKVGAVRTSGPVPLRPAQRPDELRASVENNLRTLGRDRLDVVNLRRLDVGPGVTAEGDQVVDLDDLLETMVAMRDEGLIGAIGLSAVNVDTLNRALPAGIACVQNAYSLVARQFEDMLELTREHGIAWVPFFPLGSAFAGMPKVTDQPEVIDAATRLGATPAQVGLAWLLQRAPHVLVIPGTSSADHLAENVAAGGVYLDDTTIAELDAIWAARGPELRARPRWAERD